METKWFPVTNKPLRAGPFLVRIKLAEHNYWITSVKYEYNTDTWYYSPNGFEYNLVCNPIHWTYIP